MPAWKRILSRAKPGGHSVETARRAVSTMSLVSVTKLAPKGRRRKAQGASPGNKYGNSGSPERAKQLLSVLQKWLTMSIHRVKATLPAPPFQAFYNLNIKPRACALGFPAGPLRGPEFRNRN